MDIYTSPNTLKAYNAQQASLSESEREENQDFVRTKEELRILKAQWKLDPCWDIENTEGFGCHYQELLEFRRDQEKQWLDEINEIRSARAEKYKISPELSDLIGYMLDRISKLEAKLYG